VTQATQTTERITLDVAGRVRLSVERSAPEDRPPVDGVLAFAEDVLGGVDRDDAGLTREAAAFRAAITQRGEAVREQWDDLWAVLDNAVEALAHLQEYGAALAPLLRIETGQELRLEVPDGAQLRIQGAGGRLPKAPRGAATDGGGPKLGRPPARSDERRAAVRTRSAAGGVSQRELAGERGVSAPLAGTVLAGSAPQARAAAAVPSPEPDAEPVVGAPPEPEPEPHQIAPAARVSPGLRARIDERRRDWRARERDFLPPWDGPLPLGTELAAWRERSGHPQRKLALRADIAQATIAQVEQSEHGGHWRSTRDRMASALRLLDEEQAGASSQETLSGTLVPDTPT
jgi:hypothetical protein